MYLADCIVKRCEWDHLCDEMPEAENEKFGKLLETLHVLVKHPDDYAEMTGKNPDVAERQYADALSAVRRLL